MSSNKTFEDFVQKLPNAKYLSLAIVGLYNYYFNVHITHEEFRNLDEVKKHFEITTEITDMKVRKIKLTYYTLRKD